MHVPLQRTHHPCEQPYTLSACGPTPLASAQYGAPAPVRTIAHTHLRREMARKTDTAACEFFDSLVARHGLRFS